MNIFNADQAGLNIDINNKDAITSLTAKGHLFSSSNLNQGQQDQFAGQEQKSSVGKQKKRLSSLV